MNSSNPLLEAWTLPFGAPPFDRIEAKHFLPALDVAIRRDRSEVDQIADNPDGPTFDNTMASLERSGSLLSRVRRSFWVLSSVQSTKAFQAIEAPASERLTAHGLSIRHDARLFARISAVWLNRAALTAEQKRLTEHSYRAFVAGGALLDAASKRRFAAIEQRLDALSIQFGHHVVRATNGWTMQLVEADCAGLPDNARDAAEKRAGEKGRYIFTLDRGVVEEFLTFSTRRDLRERIWHAFVERCDGGAHDNWPILNEIVALRQERARLLGFQTFAEEKLEDSMAGSPQAAMRLLDRIWAPARARASAELVELESLAQEPIAAWDWRFWSEQLKRKRHSFNGDCIKDHLTLTAVRDAAFSCASRLYGLTFEPRPDIPGWHADVEAWGVSDVQGSRGLIYTDFFARAEKHGGAWMGSLRVQELLDGPVLPIVYVVANFSKLDDGARLSIDEARTLFHEFGHALHALLSKVTYPSLAGTAVPRDFVEFPSKLMEHWIVADEILASLGVPAASIEAIGLANTFGQGISTIELTGASIVDLAIHWDVKGSTDVKGIEASVLKRIGMPPEIGIRHRLPHFTHIFDGGYGSAYYSYLWSEVLDADAFAAFSHAGLFAPTIAKKFLEEILEPGGARDPALSFAAFRGRAPSEDYLLRSRGLVN